MARAEGLIDRLFSGSQLEPAMVDAVRSARAAGVRTGLISNSWGTGRYPHELLGELFDGVVLSGAVGIRKPAPRIYELGAEAIDAGAILTQEADLFSPNALGAILTEQSIVALKCKVVAGGANNQLAMRADGQRLHDRGILYAPDYVINAGGIINVGLEYLGQGDRAEVDARVDRIPLRLAEVWDESDRTGDPESEVADRIAQRLIGRG